MSENSLAVRKKGMGVPFAWSFLLLSAVLWGSFSAPAQAVPSFSRQTGMSCMACHTAFPELTPYGRWFKLNGYVSGESDKVTEKDDKTGDVSMEIDKAPPLSAMLQISDSFVKNPTTAVPGPDTDLQGYVAFPEQLSLFYAGEISPNIGAFIQATYDFGSGVFHSDNTDVRYATHFQLDGRDAIFGLTLNNNPTVQDVWNTVPAWGFPYATSANIPQPTAAPQITTLGGSVGGLGAYLNLDKLVYVEASAYRSAPQAPAAVGSASIQGYAPYARVAFNQEVGDSSFELGGFVFSEDVAPAAGIPAGFTADNFTDFGIDAQAQYITKEIQPSLQVSWIREYQTLNSTFNEAAPGSANLDDQLELFRINGTFYYQRSIGFTVAYFGLGGTTDDVIYTPTPYSGSATGDPTSNGMIYEINYLPWLNTKLTLQYTAYWKFNGGGDNVDPTTELGYDGATARKASDNNTLMAMAWLAF